jgi:hypothetical protein
MKNSKYTFEEMLVTAHIVGESLGKKGESSSTAF